MRRPTGSEISHADTEGLRESETSVSRGGVREYRAIGRYAWLCRRRSSAVYGRHDPHGSLPSSVLTGRVGVSAVDRGRERVRAAWWSDMVRVSLVFPGEDQAYEEQMYCPIVRLSHNPMIFGFQERNNVADTLRALVVYAVVRLSQLSPLVTWLRVHALGTHVVSTTTQSSESVAACKSPVVTPYC